MSTMRDVEKFYNDRGWDVIWVTDPDPVGLNTEPIVEHLDPLFMREIGTTPIHKPVVK